MPRMHTLNHEPRIALPVTVGAISLDDLLHELEDDYTLPPLPTIDAFDSED